MRAKVASNSPDSPDSPDSPEEGTNQKSAGTRREQRVPADVIPPCESGKGVLSALHAWDSMLRADAQAKPPDAWS